mgnify:CR=1 FL=1
MDKPMTYKGYTAKIEYSEKDECLIGCVSNIRHTITFHGDSVKEIKQAFEEAVDHYLDGCAEKNEEPEKPFEEGRVVRMSAGLHRMIALAARNENKSVGEWIAEARNKPRGNKDE